MIKMPMFLFKGKYKALSSNTKIVYTLICDRFNDDYYVGKTEKGYYITFKREELAEKANISERTAIKCMKDLSDIGLIQKDRINFKASRIYLEGLK